MWVTFTHKWPFLIASVLVAIILKLYFDPQKVSTFLIRHKQAGVIGATAAAVGAPLCSCGTTAADEPATCCFEATESQISTLDYQINKAWVTSQMFLEEAFTTGKRLLLMFFGFAFIGYFLTSLIPPAWVSTVFGQGSDYSVPLAASLGLPLYINSEASLPLVRALIDGGMSQGAALAFLITGAGTSIGAIAGALTIARWRVMALVIGTLWVGGTSLGLVYNLVLASGIL